MIIESKQRLLNNCRFLVKRGYNHKNFDND